MNERQPTETIKIKKIGDKLKLNYGRAQMAFTVLDQIIYEIDKICASPRDKRADLLMNYRGRLYNLRSQYKLEMEIIKELE